MEETRPLLVERMPDIVEPAASEYSSSTTSTTAVLLLATFVTFTGSFDSGCAVSTHQLYIYIFREGEREIYMKTDTLQKTKLDLSKDRA